MKTGRRDSKKSYPTEVANFIPNFNDSMSLVLSRFQSVGAHSVGRVHCINIVDRLYPTVDPTLDSEYVEYLKHQCSSPPPKKVEYARDAGETPLVIDNLYYKNLLEHKGLLLVDEELVSVPRTSPFVEKMAADNGYFHDQFSRAFLKLSENNLLSLLFLCFSGDVVTVGTTEFDFGTLTLTSLKLLGDAHLNNGSVRLTRDLSVPNSGASRVLYSKPVRFRQPGSQSLASFSTFFSFSVTNLNPSSIGGGLAFVISPDDESVGDAGPYLGLMKQDGTPKGVVAVEFDTLMDVQFKDINGNHVGLDLNSMFSSQIGDLETIGIDLKSGDLVNSWIDYSWSTQIFNISVSYSNLKPKEPLLSVSLDLDQYVDDFMFVGFSGSTQGSTEIHSIEWWSFSSSFDVNSKSGSSSSSPPPPTSNLMNPTANSVNPPPPYLAPSESNATTLQTPEKNSKCHKQLCKEGAGAVVGVVTAGAFVLALFAIVLIWVYSKKFKHVKKSESLASEIIKMPKEFSYKDLKSATKCFNSTRIIGHGAFGTVYKGILPDTGDIVAVKRCSHSGQGKAEFFSELSIIGSLRHRNLVRLQGWCHEKGEILLVYDLMPNGSLDKALFESRMSLPWPHRRKILMGVASALAYLHQECENQVIHRDVKTSNIMLDEEFNARLGDFGLARQIEHDKSPDVTVAAGTMGYLAPEYLLTGRATEKTDVFSYGAVVLEVACGRRPIEKEAIGVGKVGIGSNLVEWVWSLHREGRLLTAADQRIGGEFDEGDMRRVLLVGLVCSHPDPMARPTMRGVVQMLVGEAEVPIVPRAKPCMSFSTSHLLLSLQDSVSDLNGMVTISTSSSEASFTGGVEELV
ncbi:hypothetical protein F0562_016448 [Nyssa sinensis]|uniref:non-specific serine/threonine protein kinase n=1 Tax=Nyssa sinensis TaxID=561372 RepID=A0A5J4ZMA1_9ASTE|nr:hypothetical protein F0562_016448 [Nyssa sinensis]